MDLHEADYLVVIGHFSSNKELTPGCEWYHEEWRDDETKNQVVK